MSAPPRAGERKGFSVGGRMIGLVLCAYAAWVVVPMLWVAAGSLKPDSLIFREPFSPPDFAAPEWDNYGRAWAEAHFGTHLWNSALLTLGATLVITYVGALAAYAIARFQHRAAGAVFWVFLIGLVVPAQLSVVPLFFQLRELGLLGTRTGLFLAYCANGLPFAVFVLAPFFRQLPKALHEAAILDGCTEWGAFWRVQLPLVTPGLASVAIFQAIGLWKEFFLAFMLLSGRDAAALQTLPLALGNLSIAAQYRSDYGMLFAGIVIVSLPVLVAYLLLQRRIEAGLTAGAVK